MNAAIRGGLAAYRRKKKSVETIAPIGITTVPSSKLYRHGRTRLVLDGKPVPNFLASVRHFDQPRGRSSFLCFLG